MTRSELGILVVDASERTREYVRHLLTIEGFQPDTVDNARGALKGLEKSNYQLMLVALPELDQDAGGFTQDAKRIKSDVEVIAIADREAIDGALRAVREGATDFITRPFDPAELVLRLDRVLERRQRETEIQRLRGRMLNEGRFHGFIGKNQQMLRVYQLIESIAPTDATVLVLGETGTGKELVARAVHEVSPRREHAFVSVNCAALPETLLESELFGHEKGAFTGAIRRKLGRFEEADKGTIFLDEIGDMPVGLQVKLLRVLQERQIRRLGGSMSIEVDVRIVLATNRDLERMVDSGEFREDLYYRINVVPVRLPSLRERLDDLPLLVAHFVEKYRGKTNSPAVGFSPAALDQMSRHKWAGNVRELENFVERALILAQDTVIDHVEFQEDSMLEPTPLPAPRPPGPDLSRATMASRAGSAPLEIPRPSAGPAALVDTSIPLKDLIGKITAEVEQEYITRLLRKYKGNIKRSYEHAGISRRAFFEKMRTYGIRKEDFK